MITCSCRNFQCYQFPFSAWAEVGFLGVSRWSHLQYWQYCNILNIGNNCHLRVLAKWVWSSSPNISNNHQMTRATILLVASATATSFGESQPFPRFTARWGTTTLLYYGPGEYKAVILILLELQTTSRGFYSSVFGYRFCLRASITFNAGEIRF